MSSTDNEYFTLRAASERAMAIAATDPRVAAIHAELAGRYEALLSARAERPKLTIVSNESASRAA